MSMSMSMVYYLWYFLHVVPYPLLWVPGHHFPPLPAAAVLRSLTNLSDQFSGLLPRLQHSARHIHNLARHCHQVVKIQASKLSEKLKVS